MKIEEYLGNISEKIAELFGLNYLPSQYNDLERCVIAAAKELKIGTSLPEIQSWLLESTLTNIELKTLSAHLTIGETYFFRERTALDLFIQKIIPDLIQHQYNTKQIRIWCAGCSSGEEPYTLAIILKENFPSLSDWDITILATDISPNAIQKALDGEYTEWSFRDTAPEIKNKYFKVSGRLWRISPEIKKMVTFSYLNLCQNSYPSSLTNTDAMDVIFCRNVMMYFTPKVIHEVSKRFYNSLKENAWLITSQVELSDDYFSDFERVTFMNGIFYQKTTKTISNIKNRATGLFQSDQFVPAKKDAKRTDVKKIIKTIEKKVIPLTQSVEKKNSVVNTPDQLFHQGQYRQCIESCLQLIGKGELDKEIFALLIKSYANSSHPTEGVESIKKIILNKKVTPEMYYLYASFLNEQNDLQESENILKKAIYLNNKHILSHLMLGDIFLKEDKKQLAIKQYGTVVDLLEEYDAHEIVPESEGITAGRIKALAESMINTI